MKHSLSLLNLTPGQQRAAAVAVILRHRKEAAQRLAMEQASRAAQASSKTPPNYNGYSSLVHTDKPHPFNDFLVRRAGLKYKAYRGGRGGGKSRAAVEAALERAKTEKILVVCTREFQNSIKDSIYRLIVNTIAHMGLKDWFIIRQDSIKCRHSNAEFIFKGLNDPDSLKSMEGADICLVEEGQSISKDSWRKLRATIRAPGSEIWVLWNPEGDEDAVDEFFFGKVKPLPSEAICHHVNFDQNPFFPLEIEMERQRDLRAIEEAENDEEREAAQAEYDHVWLGEKLVVSREIVYSGKFVLREFDEDEILQRAIFVGQALDYGYAQSPAAALRGMIVQEGDKQDLYISREAYKIGVEVDDYPGFLEDGIPDFKKVKTYCDSARKELTSLLRRHMACSMEDVEKWPGSIMDGVRFVRKFRKIIVHTRCPNTYRESKQYKYRKRKDGTIISGDPIDANNDAMDCIRYLISDFVPRNSKMKIWEVLGGQR